MLLLNRYIITEIVRSTIWVIAVLLGIDVVFSFAEWSGRPHSANELGMLYIGYRVPEKMNLYFPIALLIGNLIAFTRLAMHNELTIMLLAGLNRWRLMIIVMVLAILCEGIAIANREYIVFQAKRVTTAQVTESDERTVHTNWLRHNNDYLSYATLQPDNSLTQIAIYRFDAHMKLQQVWRAQRAWFESDYWQLAQVEITTLGTRVDTHHFDRHTWKTQLSPIAIQLATADATLLPLSTLWRHYDTLQHAQRAELWRYIVRPLATIALALLAVALIIPRLNRVNTTTIFIGSAIGIIFYVVQYCAHAISLAWHISPVIVFIIPPIAMLVINGMLLFFRKSAVPLLKVPE